MLGVILALLAVTAFSVHYVFIERPRRRERELAGSRPEPLPLSDLVAGVPDGVFLHPTFTWGRLRTSGDVDLGIHPLLLGLVGESGGISPCARPGRIEKGQPIAEVVSGDRRLLVRSPTSGEVLETNARLTAEASWRGATLRNGSWVCRVKPDRLSAEVGSWLISDAAVEWTKRRYGDVRDCILGLAFRGEPHLMLADGGEIPVGILPQLDDAAWRQFDKDFLSSTS